MNRVWAIRIGNPHKHNTYYASELFFERKSDCEKYIRSKGMWAKQNYWKAVRLVEKGKLK